MHTDLVDAQQFLSREISASIIFNLSQETYFLISWLEWIMKRSSTDINDILSDRASPQEKKQALIISALCILVVAAGVLYLFFQARDERSLYNGYASAVLPMVNGIEHSFDALDYPVDLSSNPTMTVWPKRDWKKISLGDGRGSSLMVMGQTKLQGRIYGVDLVHGAATRYISPVDISLGWKAAASDESFATIDVSHGNREALLKPKRKWPTHQFTNTHLIPAGWDISKALKSAKPNDRIAITAWPVTVRTLGIRPWSSDLKYGNNDCEILLVTAVRIESPDGAIRQEAEL